MTAGGHELAIGGIGHARDRVVMAEAEGAEARYRPPGKRVAQGVHGLLEEQEEGKEARHDQLSYTKARGEREE
jgi:hypothetical protein